MKALANPIFLFSCVAYAALKATRYSNFRVPLVHDYVADVLCMPVVLTLSMVAMRLLRQNPGYQLNRAQIITTVLMFAILFEGLFPLMSPRFTADPIDILCYAAGALLFSKWMNK